MFSENTIINQRYKLGKKIGQGGFAQVFLGEDLLLKRQIAIKVLNPEFTQEPGFLESFEKEAQSVAALSHPNILSVFDYGYSDGSAFLVMPYISGGTLFDLIRRDKKISLEKVNLYIKQAATAIDYAHRQKIIHRDIKPQNILIDVEEDHVLLADFGIAKVLSSASTKSGTTIMGTLGYMSPEQLAGKAGKASDIYALGCLTFQLLTGNLPYEGSTERVVMGHLTGAIPSIVEVSNGQIAASFQGVIDLALAKKPEERYQTASDLAKALSLLNNDNALNSFPKTQIIPPLTPSLPTQSLVEKEDVEFINSKTEVAKSYPVTQIAGNLNKTEVAKSVIHSERAKIASQGERIRNRLVMLVGIIVILLIAVVGGILLNPFNSQQAIPTISAIAVSQPTNIPPTAINTISTQAKPSVIAATTNESKSPSSIQPTITSLQGTTVVKNSPVVTPLITPTIATTPTAPTVTTSPTVPLANDAIKNRFGQELVGQTGTQGGFNAKVSKVLAMADVTDPLTNKKVQAQGIYLAVFFEITNNGKTPGGLRTGSVTLQDQDGRNFTTWGVGPEPSTALLSFLSDGYKKNLIDEVQPGFSGQNLKVFDIPTDAVGLKVIIAPK